MARDTAGAVLCLLPLVLVVTYVAVVNDNFFVQVGLTGSQGVANGFPYGIKELDRTGSPGLAEGEIG
jgi:hypothetical protein